MPIQAVVCTHSCYLDGGNVSVNLEVSLDDGRAFAGFALFPVATQPSAAQGNAAIKSAAQAILSEQAGRTVPANDILLLGGVV